MIFDRYYSTFPCELFRLYYEAIEKNYDINREFMVEELRQWLVHQKSVPDGLSEICRANIIVHYVGKYGKNAAALFDMPFDGDSPLERLLNLIFDFDFDFCTECPSMLPCLYRYYPSEMDATYVYQLSRYLLNPGYGNVDICVYTAREIV